MNDRSKEFSLKYLSVLEKVLQVNWASNGDPIVSIEAIDETTVEALAQELMALLHSSTAQEAIEYERRCSRNEIVSVGFGLTGNFSDFVKLGLLCGDRVVLWDILASKTLRSGVTTQSASDRIAELAGNLLTLKPLVEDGAVVVLPHPTMWSELARDLLTELKKNSLSTSDVGFLTALVAIIEGMQLHPYTLAATPDPSPELRNTDGAKEFYSKSNQDFQKSVSALLEFEGMKYLREVKPTDFYDSLQDKGDFKRALRGQLAMPVEGLSEQQKASEREANIANLMSLLERRNAKVLSYASGVGEASIGAISGTVAAFSVETAILQAAALGVNSLVQFWSAGHKVLQSPPKNVLVQTFARLEGMHRPAAQDVSIDHFSKVSNASQEARDAYFEFMSFHWTEERHYFLKGLSADMAREVLSLVSSSDLQIIVNWRRHQEDYIGDYLEYLSSVDKDAYWDHLSATFGGEDGLLMYDNLHHVEMMTSRSMPMHVWDSMLSAILSVHWKEIERKKAGFPLEYFPEIIRFQTIDASDHLAKREQFVNFVLALRPKDMCTFLWFVDEVYDGERPEWLVPALNRAENSASATL